MPKPPHSKRGQGQTPQQQPQQQQRTQVELQQWTGPLPPPAALERFNDIIPGGADRILAMAEKEQGHRIEYESTGLRATTEEAKRGQYLGSVLSAVALLGAVFVVYLGGPWEVSVALVGIPVLGIIRAIVKPRPK